MQVKTYSTPLCELLDMTSEGSVLVVSGLLQDMGDNTIYTEDF